MAQDKNDEKQADKQVARDAKQAEKQEAKAAKQAEKVRGDSGEQQVDEAFEEANERGYFGTTTDPTPDENYTVEGVANGAPTPETDEEANAEARAFLERNRTR